MNNTKIIGIVVVLGLIIGGVFLFGGEGEGEPVASGNKLDIIDTVSSFYVGALKDLNITPAPELCQSKIPTAEMVRTIYERGNEAQVLVTSKDKSNTTQAVVKLNKGNSGWEISNIKCSAGEFAPEKEFSFENEGYLIKTSVPKPYNSKNWHLVYEQNGQTGNVTPLIFDAKSECIALDATKSTCKPDKLTELTKVRIKGQLTERGALVTQLEVVK